jgi:RecA-family ATPase
MILPYKWPDISAARYNLTLPPEPQEFLVEEFLPQGIVGTVYSRGGIGKSILMLDLAIRVALAGKGVESEWLCKFPVIRGGKVLILTGEDPEKEIQSRLYHRLEAIAAEDQADKTLIQRAISENIAVINCWGSTRPYGLFRKVAGRIAPSESCERLRLTVEAEKPALIIVDTRSRFTGGVVDENSNPEVAAEVSLYETLASHGATVLIAHHSNKSSYGGPSDNPGAFRGASAWQDNLRWALYLSSAKDSGSSDLIRIDVPKSNYTRPIKPFYLRRLESPKFGFALVNGESIPDGKEARLDADLGKIVTYLKTHPGLNKTEVMRDMKGQDGKAGLLSWHRAAAALKYGMANGSLVETKDKTICLRPERQAPKGDLDPEISDFALL